MQNIVGTFDDASSARRALDRLVEMGVPRGRVYFQPSADAEFLAHAGPARTRPGKPGYKRQGVLESIGGFFANLFESHTDESGIYSEALRRGTCLLLAQAEDPAQARRIIDVLLDSGAVGLEDRVGQWRAEGWAPPDRKDDAATATDGSPAGTHGSTAAGAPLGTHSFTGGGAAVGMPTPSGGAQGEDLAAPKRGHQTAQERERAVAAAERGGLPREREPRG